LGDVATPAVAVWLTSCTGRRSRIKWWLAARAHGTPQSSSLIVLNAQDPRNGEWSDPLKGCSIFEPSLARTATGQFIPDQAMMSNYTACSHKDNYNWFHSVITSALQ
jgi:hypothetical protein